jgi:hypothetical protein
LATAPATRRKRWSHRRFASFAVTYVRYTGKAATTSTERAPDRVPRKIPRMAISLDDARERGGEAIEVACERLHDDLRLRMAQHVVEFEAIADESRIQRSNRNSARGSTNSPLTSRMKR